MHGLTSNSILFCLQACFSFFDTLICLVAVFSVREKSQNKSLLGNISQCFAYIFAIYFDVDWALAFFLTAQYIFLNSKSI